MKLPMKALREIVLFTQLGFSLVTPPLVLLWLCRVFSLGGVWRIVAIVVGILAGVSAAYSSFRQFLARQKKSNDSDDSPVGFNSHD